MFKHWGLTKQFAFVFLVFITIPTILFGTLIYFQTTKTFKNQAEQNTIDLLDKNDENLTTAIRSIESMSSYIIYNEDFRTFFLTKEGNSASEAYRRAEEGIKGYFTFQITSQSYIDSVYLEAQDGHTLSFGNPVTGDEERLKEQARNREGAIYWSNSYPVSSAWDGNKYVLSLNRQVNDINDINESIGLVRIRIDQESLFETYSAGTGQEQGNFFVMDKDGEVVLHEDRETIDEPFPSERIIDLVVESDTNSTRYVTENNSFLVVKKQISGTDWFSVAIVDEADIVGELYRVRSLIVAMVLLLIFLGIIAFIGFYRFNIKRIVELTDQTAQLESGDFAATVKITSHDEIGRLGMRFNHMVKKIHEYIEKEYKLKIRQRESELKSLQNQVDPHFLYNTLDMIRWTARMEQAMKTGKQIEQLSKIFRINLNQGRTWITLREEEEYIKSYLDLQKNRIGDRLSYTFEVEPHLKEALIMKQMLQPLIENSIVHGFANQSSSAIIDIRVYEQAGTLIIDVTDNGRGLPDGFTLEQEGSFALSNIEERIRMTSGNNYGLSSIPYEQGAWMRLRLPLFYDNETPPEGSL